MLRVIYILKMALGWICWHVWHHNSEWIQDIYWLNSILLPWDAELADAYEDWT